MSSKVDTEIELSQGQETSIFFETEKWFYLIKYARRDGVVFYLEEKLKKSSYKWITSKKFATKYNSLEEAIEGMKINNVEFKLGVTIYSVTENELIVSELMES